jgi:hypothetical protein
MTFFYLCLFVIATTACLQVATSDSPDGPGRATVPPDIEEETGGVGTEGKE